LLPLPLPLPLLLLLQPSEPRGSRSQRESSEIENGYIMAAKRSGCLSRLALLLSLAGCLRASATLRGPSAVIGCQAGP